MERLDYQSAGAIRQRKPREQQSDQQTLIDRWALFAKMGRQQQQQLEAQQRHHTAS